MAVVAAASRVVALTRATAASREDTEVSSTGSREATAASPDLEAADRRG